MVLWTEQSSANTCVDCQHPRDAFPSTTNSENLETRENGTEMTGSRKSGNVEFLQKENHLSENPRNSGTKVKLRLRNFRNFQYTLQSCPLFQKFREKLYHLSLEISRN